MKKLAMIGCGGIGGYHLGHFLQFKDIELAGFCDLIISRAEEFVRRAGSGKAYVDYRKMLDEVQPDMVFVCIPPYAHGQIEFELIERGIPFFVEKPIAIDEDLARELNKRVTEKGLITAVGFQCRYDNINDAAFQFFKQEQVIVAQASRVGGVPGVEWWRNKAQSGGQLVEQTIHQLDILRYFLGEPEYVYSVAARGYISQKEWPGYFTDDLSTTLIVFKNGVQATMMTGCYALEGAAWDSKMTFGGRNARMDYVLCERVTVYGLTPEDAAPEVEGLVIKGDGALRRSDSEKGITTRSNVDFGLICDRTFIDAVLTGDGSKIRSPYGDAYKTVMFALACNKSMATGQPVKIEY
ncbi:MAG TPA: Gfo/Idh/MocA family oxidoreductase [Bacillota bacterium]|nr:Gfo/Idh/MocA family oxidoreductase [Clostridiales bacterium]HPT85999.1 Gfo/Idh/MocA family oxidoreductase [Bacillota bacterium]